MKYVESGTDYNHSVAYTYDTINNLTAQVETINGVETTTGYTYDEDNRVTAVEAGGTKKLYTYDGLGRVITETVKQGDTTILTTTYTYENPTTDTTSGRVATKQIEAIGNYDFSYTYAYDDNGNIVSVREDDDITTYTYDAQNQLIRENDGVTNCTYTWEYDNAGNIQNCKEYAYTTTEDIANQTPVYTTDYTYDTQWKDLLVEYDDCEITYDEIGNPTSFMGKTYTWQHGRQLASLSYGSNNWVYTYNADGMRTSRVNGDTAYTYVYNGGQLVKMTMNDDVLTFTYDANGAPLTVTWNGTTYYYVTNLQGDVVAILDSTGNCMASYTYSAWGQTYMEITELEKLNPLRYRGYVYDQEYALYYLQSRYYDPQIGRFINADNQLNPKDGLLGFNMCAYSQNNPIAFSDPTGHSITLACIIVGAVFGAVVGGCITAHVSKKKTGKVNGWAVAAGVVGGGVVGGLIGWGVGAAITAAGAATTGVIGGTVAQGSQQLYSNWQSAEQGLRAAINSVSDHATRVLSTPLGNRLVDAYNVKTKVVAEAKYGYQALSTFIKTEVARDAWLLETGAVREVQWHFYYSHASQSIGGSYPLIRALLDAGIDVIYH